MPAITFNDTTAKGQLTEKIRQSLEDVVDSQRRHYQTVYALSFHFAKDSAAFISIASSLGVENPRVFTIPDLGNDSRAGPEYAVVQKLWKIFISCAPVLVLLHYTGHGEINNKDELVFTPILHILNRFALISRLILSLLPSKRYRWKKLTP